MDGPRFLKRNARAIARKDCDELTFQEHFSTFPEQLQACLKITGYNSVQAFVALKDTKQIETYIRKKGDLIKRKNPELAETALGIDIDNPEEFEMPPGIMVILDKYINSFAGNKDSEEKKTTTTKKERFHSPTTNKRASNGTIQNGEEFNGYPIWKKISENIAKWCSLQPSPVLKQFKHDQDYCISVTPTKASVKCLHCEKDIFLSNVKNKDTYVISNFTRHLKKCTGSTNTNTKKVKKVPKRVQRVARCSETDEANLAAESLSDQMVLLSENNQENMYQTIVIIPDRRGTEENDQENEDHPEEILDS